MKNLLLIFSFLLISLAMNAQEVNDLILKGNELYKQQKFAEAEKEFLKALEKEPSNQTVINNLASAQYRQKKNEEARKEFGKLTIGEKTETSTKSTAFYNIGAVLSKEKKLEESIEVYKQSLRLDPADKQTRENLQKALIELKKKQQPDKKKENKNKKQQQNQQKQNQSKLNRKEVEKQLQLLQQKEKEVKQRMQNEKLKEGGGGQKDW
jgi:Ca-activated chloride channel family protein